jgi:hypothetical protein
MLAELSLYGKFYHIPETLFYWRDQRKRDLPFEQWAERLDTSHAGAIPMPRLQVLAGYLRTLERVPLDPDERKHLVRAAQGLRFLALDELHTYRGRQGADVAMLIRRCREAFQSKSMRCVGTSATMTSGGDSSEQARVVAEVAFEVDVDAALLCLFHHLSVGDE